MWLQDIAQRYGIKGFPTIKLFGSDKDSPMDYEGERSASAIESYAISQLELNVAAPEVVELVGQVNLQQHVWSGQMAVLAKHSPISSQCFFNLIFNILAVIEGDWWKPWLQDVLDKECGSAAICFVSFLPDILDSKAEGRNKYLTTLRNVAEKYKRNAYR